LGAHSGTNHSRLEAEMSEYVMAHPWLTFFMVLALIQGGGNVLVSLFGRGCNCGRDGGAE
jgi:hypothetical protein